MKKVTSMVKKRRLSQRHLLLSSIPLPFGRKSLSFFDSAPLRRSRVLSPTPVPQGWRPLDSGADRSSQVTSRSRQCRSRRVRWHPSSMLSDSIPNPAAVRSGIKFIKSLPHKRVLKEGIGAEVTKAELIKP